MIELQMPRLPNLSLERAFDGIVAGVDEAGCGPWAGPVVAAAVILDVRKYPKGIDDSKRLKPGAREALFDLLIAKAHTGVGIASVEEIDSLNILNAAKLAMQRAVDALGVAPQLALIDGNRPPELACRVTAIVQGDRKSLSIAAASIIAKVTRDRLMAKLAQECPHYGWERNMGYGTKAHQNGLLAHGVTIHHRRSFAPIRNLIANGTLFEEAA